MRNAIKQIPFWLMVIYVLALLALVVWPCAAFTSIFAFDAPGSAQQSSTYVYVGIALLYPILPIAGVLGSFFAQRGQHKPLAYILAAVAVLPSATIAFLLGASQIAGILTMMGVKF
jgi:Na+-driven multidrug efflux pump